MTKILMGPQTLIYPMPALLVGANVNDKPNFMTVARGGIANSEPPMISVAYWSGVGQQLMELPCNIM
jgi:hypothetical protein